MTRTHPCGDDQILEEDWRSALTHTTWEGGKIILSCSIWRRVFFAALVDRTIYSSCYVFKSTLRRLDVLEACQGHSRSDPTCRRPLRSLPPHSTAAPAVHAWPGAVRSLQPVALPCQAVSSRTRSFH